MSRVVFRLLSCRSWVLQTAWFPRPNCCKSCRINHQLRSLAAVVAVAVSLGTTSRNRSGKDSLCSGVGLERLMVQCNLPFHDCCGVCLTRFAMPLKHVCRCSCSWLQAARTVQALCIGKGTAKSALHWYLATSSTGRCAGGGAPGSNASIEPVPAYGGKPVIMSGPP